ncbi:MAG: TVP38/TMEM64 family protein [Halodesulfurarchaeum sp.]
MPLTRSRVLLGLGLLVLLGLALLFRPDAVFSRLRSVLFSPYFPLILVLLYAVRPFLGWPISLLSGLVGYRYGIIFGLPIALLGVVATSLVPYSAGRYFDATGPILGRFGGGSRRYFDAAGDVRGVVAARLAPTPAEPISAAAGIGGVGTGAFVLGTLLGELPWTIAAVYVGHSLDTFSIGGLGYDWRLIAGGVIASLVLLARPIYDVYVRRRSS